MEDFLLENYMFLTRLVESIAVLTGLIFYKKYRNTPQKYFIWFLIYTLLVEVIGSYTVFIHDIPSLKFIKDALRGTLIQKNYWWFTIFWAVGSALFYAFYFYKNLKNMRFRLIVKYAGTLFLISSVCYLSFNFSTLFKAIMPFIKLSGAAVIFICTILYFIELLKSDQVLSFYRSLNFYISSTIFIWWLVTTPVVFFEIYFSSADWNFVFLRWQIFLFMNIFMYLTFSFALLWCKPQND
ncbi:hypothetical protein ACS386_12675 [Flavobacteriaceae bacterium LMO-SS05]